MPDSCLVCGGRCDDDSIENVFDETHILASKKQLSETLSEIINTTLHEETVATKKLCQNCFKDCNGYDMHKINTANLKSKLCEQYRANIEKSSTEEMAVINAVPTPKPIKLVRDKLVVPASKLIPLPADFQLNLSKIAAVTMANTKGLTPKPLLNLKVTIGNSVLTQSLTTSTVKISKPLASPEQVGEWNVSSIIPNELFHGDDGDGNGDEGDDGDEGEDGDEGDGNDNDMEIDEESSSAQVDSMPVIIDANDIKTEYSDSVDSYSINGNFMRNNFIRMLESEQVDQPSTIVVDGDNSILQMMSGQKLVYENGQLSLVMDDNGDDDGQDSNDEESQIELQVSGDEETANAIIAAAQEQGGAFIKVESGEMYRVKSVQSKPSDAKERVVPDTVTHLVAKDGDKYKCLICENSRAPIKKTFQADADTIMSHMKTEHSAKVYICGLCGIIMRNRSEYTAHTTEHANVVYKSKGYKSYHCEVCKKTYNSKTLLQEHMNSHTGSRPYACHVCDKTFASKYTRQAHLKTHQKRPRPFQCFTCDKSFLSRPNLAQHEKTHLGIKSFVCTVCNKAFGTQHNLEIHGVVHSGQKSYACDVCSKAFARRAELRDHVRIHTGERPFECDVCGAKFTQRSNLHSHKRATHIGDRRHVCQHCPKRFKRRRLLEYHIKAVHTGERPLKCEICLATFVYPEHYKKHVRIHNGERPYYCEICGKAFNSRDNRNTHRFVHSDKKPYECLACGASYMRKRMLVHHMNANGHLAESIVVNQPRVTKVFDEDDDTGLKESFLPNKKEDEERQDEIKCESSTLIAGDSMSSQQEGVVATVNSEGGLEPTQMSDENGDILRFIQVQMPDGGDGWVVLND